MSSTSTKLLAGKKGIITGVANNMSISWAIAQIAKEHGADIALTYQGEVLKKRVLPLAEEVGCDFVQECDVTDEASMDKLFEVAKEKWGKIDFIIHSIAFADRNELRGAIYLQPVKTAEFIVLDFNLLPTGAEFPA